MVEGVLTSLPGSPYYDPYAAEEMQRKSLRQRWIGGVAGMPLYGQIGMWAAAAAGVRGGAVPETRRATLPDCGGLAGCRGVRCRAGRAGRSGSGGPVTSGSWAWALEYRRWVCRWRCRTTCWRSWRRASTPAGGAAGRVAGPPESLAPGRVPLAFVLTSVFAAVISLQSVTWAVLVRRMMVDVPQLPGALRPGTSHVDWSLRTPLEHWGAALVRHGPPGQAAEEDAARAWT